MAQKSKQWGAIIVMIALFAMIAFVTNLCTPMATIIKNQGSISNVLAQIGNYGNFVAYLVMGIPAGLLISKFGYKKTALGGLLVGMVGIAIQWFSGQLDAQANLGLVFAVYLTGAFIAGLCMAILNSVVNPMLNVLGGGGNSGNQLIQLGGVFNSSAAVACYILMGALIGEASKAKISDATPALLIAFAIFAIAFVVIFFTKIEEPAQESKEENTLSTMKLVKGALGFRHFALGALAIFLYMGIEVGVPNLVQQYLSSDNETTKRQKVMILQDYENKKTDVKQTARLYVSMNMKVDSLMQTGKTEDYISVTKKLAEIEKRLTDSDQSNRLTSVTESRTVTGLQIPSNIVGMLVAVYWAMMLVGRFVGASIGSKVSSRTMVTAVTIATLLLVLFGMFAPSESTVNFPGVDWGELKVVWQQIPLGTFAFLLVGLCTSVMWGAIFNLAVEGLGRFTAIASGIFMTMVFGCAVMLAIQAKVADVAGYVNSAWVVVFCAAYILFYALVGSRVSRREEA